MARVLVRYATGLPIDQVEDMPISLFWQYANQGVNLGNLCMGGDFKFITPEDEEKNALAEYLRLKEQGRI